MADKTNDTVVDPVAAAVRRLEERGQREEAALVAAAQERARPACELARAALPAFAAFEQAHGAWLRERVAMLEAPRLKEVPTIVVVLAEARAYGAELIALLESPKTIRTYLGVVERLTPQDLRIGAVADGPFTPSLVGTAINGLTNAAGNAERLSDLLGSFKAKWDQLEPRLAKVPELLPVPRGGFEVEIEDVGPRRAPRFAKSSIGSGE
jgi:hypothetical protein